MAHLPGPSTQDAAWPIATVQGFLAPLRERGRSAALGWPGLASHRAPQPPGERGDVVDRFLVADLAVLVRVRVRVRVRVKVRVRVRVRVRP